MEMYREGASQATVDIVSKRNFMVGCLRLVGADLCAEYYSRPRCAHVGKYIASWGSSVVQRHRGWQSCTTPQN